MAKQKNSMAVVPVHMPEALLEGLNQLVDLRMYKSRSEAVRTAVRDLLLRELGREWAATVNAGGREP